MITGIITGMLTVATAAGTHTASPDSRASRLAGSERYLADADSARICIAAEKWSEAEEYLLHALRLEPANFNNSLLLSNLGVVRTHLENYDAALEAFDISLAIAPHSSATYTNRARTYLRLDRQQEAIADLSSALEIDPGLISQRKIRGFLLLAAGKTEEAKQDFELIEHIKPVDADVLAGLADCCARTGDSGRAIELYTEAIKLHPDEMLYASRAELHLAAGDTAAALDDVRDGLMSAPRSARLLLIRAAINRSRYQNAAAENDIKTAIEYGADLQTVRRYLPSYGIQK